MTGIELIAQERAEQINKHGRTLEYDRKENWDTQLSTAAGILCYEDIEEIDAAFDTPPTGWSLELWQKMWNKPYRERLIIAGALIAAEIDRVTELEIERNHPKLF